MRCLFYFFAVLWYSEPAQCPPPLVTFLQPLACEYSRLSMLRPACLGPNATSGSEREEVALFAGYAALDECQSCLNEILGNKITLLSCSTSLIF